MASVQEPEVQFAQKLASNDKPTRTKAIKKLRKYINVRSQRAAGGFTSDDLLKLWKGLFYCLWMQDKPLLQEELSKQISGLIHSFHDPEGQFLYLESFLLTLKREWTGIDRLRMDKFFQLVRFMFRQTFELLKRTDWESSMVSRFLQLVVTQLLQTGSDAPSGLQFHVLDLYMTELAAMGSAELTADQNLTFIEPFCKTAARTKDRTLFRAICSSIFSTIIDQAPFAIEDLMKEMGTAEDLDSESEEDHKDQKEAKTSKPLSKKSTGKQINGNKSDDEDEDDEDDEFLHLEESDTESQGEADVGPVLQFDYGALANKLLALSGRSSTPSHNRQRLYKIVKVLRDLSEGVFPQDEYPEEVSTDEDDDMFGSRTRMKRGSDPIEDEEGAPAQKKSKGKKKEAATLDMQTKDSGIDEQADLNSNDEKKKKKRKKKKKKTVTGASAAGEENAEKVEQAQNEAQSPNPVKETEGSSPAAEGQSSVSSVTVTVAATADGQSETLLLSEVKKQPSVTVTEEASAADSKDQSESVSETPESPKADAPVSGKKKKKKNLKAASQADGDEKTENTEPESTSLNNQASEMTVTAPDTDTVIPAKKKGKKKMVKADVQPEVEPEASQDTTAQPPKKTKKKQRLESSSAEGESTTTLVKNKRKKGQKIAAVDAETLDETEAVSSSKKATKKKRKIPVVFEFEADEQEASINGLAEEETSAKKTKLGNDAEEPAIPLSLKKSQKKVKAASKSDFMTFQSHAVAPTPLFCKTKGGCCTPLSSKKGKKSQTPTSESKKVTFGLKNNKTAEFRKTDRSLLVSPDGSSRVAFDPKQKPKFGVLKSPATPLSTSIKKANKKTSLNTQKSTPKRRPSAADFF